MLHQQQIYLETVVSSALHSARTRETSALASDLQCAGQPLPKQHVPVAGRKAAAGRGRRVGQAVSRRPPRNAVGEVCWRRGGARQSRSLLQCQVGSGLREVAGHLQEQASGGGAFKEAEEAARAADKVLFEG